MAARQPNYFQLLGIMAAARPTGRPVTVAGPKRVDEPKPEQLPDDLELTTVWSKRGKPRTVVRRVRERP